MPLSAVGGQVRAAARLKVGCHGGFSPLSVLSHLERLRQAYGGLDGLALLRGVLEDSPLAGRIALVSSFGAESAVLLDMVASVDRATR